ncbi:sensor histidine kinase [Methanosarcina sp. MSH10X1]|nr:sensor histidine kinase [Methanosarcina sp. MSH10X1]
MNIAGRIQKWLTFGLSPEQEDRFRQANFGGDIAQARIFVLLILLPFLALLVNDYSFLGLSSTFYALLALRLAFTAYTVLFLKNLRGFPNYRSYDRAEFIWGLFLAVFHVTINSTRPENFVAHTVITVLVVFITMLAIPNRFTNQLILSLVYTSGQTLIIAPNPWISPQASFTVLLSMFMANAIAIASGWLFNFWRRREFLTHEEMHNAKLEIETQLTERKKAEEVLANIETARKKEIHHRIKNNLQVISSLLDLQADQFRSRNNIKNSEVLTAFRESQDRVLSMALIHEELYRGEGLETLNFSSYIEELAGNLLQTYRLGNLDINLDMDLEKDSFFDMDTAVPLGIIVNELISNSLKHAFPDRHNGTIRITLHREGNRECISSIVKSEGCKGTAFVLKVSDNGVGIPENLDIEELDSLGMQLVTSLADQIDGKLELRTNHGTEIIIRFTLTDKK